jgi:cytochrome c oxidase cbb3-type subunit 1
MVAAGAMYHMIEKIFNVRLNQKLLATHFWIHTMGTLLYIIAMWISGITQGLMWRAYDEYGTLAYTFAESVAAMHPYYVMRMTGGILVVIGAILMLINIVTTIRKSEYKIKALS